MLACTSQSNRNSSCETSDDHQAMADKLSVQWSKMNEFLRSCDAGSVGPYKKRWEEASMRTKQSHVSKAKEAVVAALNVIAPGEAGHLWEALKASNSVEKALQISEECPVDKRYLEALAETYQNASSWDTRRQVLSVMADLVTFKQIQRYIPGLTCADAQIRVWSGCSLTCEQKSENAC